MIFAKTGKLLDFFHVLGSKHFPTHMLPGPKPVLFEAGLSCLGPIYVKAVEKILKDGQPQLLFLTHAHFDHCGAAGFLQQIDGASLQHLVVAHVSENNNCRLRAEAALNSVLDNLDRVVWADQHEGFSWLQLG